MRLRRAAQGAPSPSVGGQARPPRLLGLLTRGLAKIETARSGPARTRAHQLVFVQAKLRTFPLVLETGMRRLKVEPILDGTLRALATGAVRDLQALRANP